MQLSREVILAEVTAAKKILDTWEAKLKNIPGVDSPGTDKDTMAFQQTLIGELSLVAAKCESLATIINNED